MQEMLSKSAQQEFAAQQDLHIDKERDKNCNNLTIKKDLKIKL